MIDNAVKGSERSIAGHLARFHVHRDELAREAALFAAESPAPTPLSPDADPASADGEGSPGAVASPSP